jgi:1-deoxy-D-xylulose-5-phosphate reductoisomerase
MTSGCVAILTSLSCQSTASIRHYWQCLLSVLESVSIFEQVNYTTILSDCVPPNFNDKTVRRATLTASGGPFREWSIDQLERATPEQALKHPTWTMGAKVTIDSATLMNKALELIEAHWLFGLPASKLDAVIHPQSLVHAIVEFLDGSNVAQLAAPDMKTPIQRALTWPFCLEGCSRRIDWTSLRSLAFEPVDHARFPAVSLAYHVMERGGTSGAILNAANEVAVEAFLAGRTGFRSITRHVEAALADIPTREVRTLADVLETDAAARDFVRGRIERGVR